MDENLFILGGFSSHMGFETWIGLLAAVSTTAGFLPQAIKTIKTKQTKDLSLGMYILMAFGLFCWLVYGILLNDLPLILANAISFTLTVVILVLKIKHG